MTMYGIEVKRVFNTFNLTRFRKVEKVENELPVTTQRELNKIYEEAEKKLEEMKNGI